MNDFEKYLLRMEHIRIVTSQIYIFIIYSFIAALLIYYKGYKDGINEKSILFDDTEDIFKDKEGGET